MIEHYSVMKNETLEGLNIQPQGRYWDGTFGLGGHSRAILERLGPEGHITGTDRDALPEQTAGTIGDERFSFIRATIEEALDKVEQPLDGIVWDLGCSTPQLKDAERGFSFKESGPLDMRMDPDAEFSAEDIVNDYDEVDLANIIYEYGEERLSRRIAKWICEARRLERITDTQTLANICRRAYPKKYHRIDPATRTFQALRIAVNDELGQLERGLPRALEMLAPGGRCVIISFHSLEDRIVKHTFRNIAKEAPYKIHTKRPLTPTDEENAENPASRSAKLRIIERLEEDPS